MTNTVNARADYMPTLMETLADAPINVGDLVELTATGVKRAATADGGYAATFAMKNVGNGGGFDEPYIAGETAKIGAFGGGGVVDARLDESQTIAVGAILTSAGNGSLKAAGTVAAGAPTFTALEAVSTGAAAFAVIKVLVN